jgi:hypothetical protein
LKKWENTVTLNPGSWIRYFSVLLTGVWGLLPKEIQVWASGSVDILYADFTIQDMKEITFGMESNKAAGCERILVEGWNVLVTKDKKVKL